MIDPSEQPEKEMPAPQQAPPPVLTVKPPSPENMWAELCIAVNYLTRLNMEIKEEPKPRFIRKSMSWFPAVGAGIGIFGGVVDWMMSQIGLPGIITATFAVISMLWATRALHEEEFASLVNKYDQTTDREAKVGWLHEERSVRYGTIGVILVIIMKIGALASLNNNDLVLQALIASSAWSRTLMVVAAAWLRPVEGDPVADHFQQPPALRVLLAVALGALIVFTTFGADATLVLATGAGAGLLVVLVGANHVRGYSGSLLGTLQQAVDLTVLGTILSLQ